MKRRFAPARLAEPLLLFALAGSSACEPSSGAASKPRENVVVKVAPVVRGDVPLEVAALGVVEASTTVDVLPQVTGLITAVSFKEGDFVKKGELLFTIDTRPYRASLAMARAELERSRALAEQAATEVLRDERLNAEGLLSEQQLAQAKADAASSKASVKMNEATLRSAGLNVAFTQITAPIDGRAGRLLVHAGNVVRTTDAQPLVVLRALSPVYVTFAVPQEYLPRIRARSAEAALLVRATLRGEGGKTAEGPLTFIDNTVDPSTGMLTLKATFANAALELWPGASADVKLELDSDRAVVIAPEAAIAEGQNGKYAFVVGPDDKAHVRPVEVARSTATQVVIRRGLEPGERVVIDGQVRLQDGMSVRVQ